MEKPDIAILGCGRVGTALAAQLFACGYGITAVVSRTLSSAEKTAAVCGIPRMAEVPCGITDAADVIFITTPDGEIESACRELGKNGGIKAGAVVLHCSGALPSSILASARDRGAHVGSLHPLQSFAADAGADNPFKGIVMSAEGDAPAVAVSEQIAADLGAVCFRIRTEAKTLYHASAVVASNYLVTLMDLSFGLLAAAGIPEENAMEVLSPLINGTLANVERVGTAPALTGPVSRGDGATIEQHVKEIEKLAPDLLGLYRALGLQTVQVGLAGGHITRDKADELNRLLEAKP